MAKSYEDGPPFLHIADSFGATRKEASSRIRIALGIPSGNRYDDLETYIGSLSLLSPEDQFQVTGKEAPVPHLIFLSRIFPHKGGIRVALISSAEHPRSQFS